MNPGTVLGLALRHEILRSMPKLWAVAAISGVLAFNIFIYRAAGEPRMIELFLLQAVILGGFATLLIKGGAGRRCRPWESTLPLPGSALWGGHFLALLIGGLLSVLLTGTMIGLFKTLQGFLSQQDLLGWGQLIGLMVRPFLLVLTISGVIAARRVGLTDLAADSRWSRDSRLLFVGLFVLLGILNSLPLVVSIVPVIIASAWVARARGKVPTTLESLPADQEENLGAGETDPGCPIPASNRALNHAVMRMLFKWPTTWIIGLPFTVLFGFLLGGLMPGGETNGFGDGSMRAVNYLIIVYLMFAFCGHFMENLYRIDHLPVSRRTLLAWLALPGIISLTVGYGASQVLLERAQRASEQILFVNQEEGYGLKVPPEFFVLSLSGEVLPIVAPWGEEMEAYSQPVLKGLPSRLWKPYTTPAGAGPEFIAWQISRAVEAVYGVEIPAAVIQERYLETGPNGQVTIREPGLTLQADYKDLRSAYRGPVFPILVGSVIILYLLGLGLFFGFFGPGVTIKKCRIAFWGTMAGLFLLHMGVFGMMMAGWTDDWLISGTVLGLARATEMAGIGSQVVVWLSFLALVGLSWVWTERRFRRVEAPRA